MLVVNSICKVCVLVDHTKVEISYVGYQTAIYKGINLLLGENYVLNVSLKESSELLDEVVVTASKEVT